MRQFFPLMVLFLEKMVQDLGMVHGASSKNFYHGVHGENGVNKNGFGKKMKPYSENSEYSVVQIIVWV